MPKPHGYWTLDRCREDAAKYEFRVDWIKKSTGAYDAAWRHGWLEQCCQHMSRLQKPNGFWNKENCVKDALRYQTRKQWEAASVSAYEAALRNGWAEECCSHMQRGRVPNGHWTLERCAKDAAQYSTRKEWRDASPLAHGAAKRLGWMDVCCAHMAYLNRANGYWTRSRCIESASRHDTKAGWRQSEQSAYLAAYDAGWLNDCCLHMEEGRKPNGYWTSEKCRSAAEGYASRVEWQASDWASYKAARKGGWLDEVALAVGIPNHNGSVSQRGLADLIRDEIAGTDVELREEVRGLVGPRARVDIACYRDNVPFLVVEYHGAHWHTEAKGKDKHYHRDRMNALRANGIRLITVHEKDKSNPVVMGMIRSALGLIERRVRASRCDIVLVGDITAREFYQTSHIQGGDVFGKDQMNIGLEIEGSLVACMTFVRSTGRDTGGGNYDWCLHRFATDPEYRVHGAAGRLFRRFRTIYPDASVVTYCDLQFFAGSMYEKIGFSLVRENPPDYGWVKATIVLDRHATRRKFLPDLLGFGYDPSTSETENMERAGYSKIWDCGKAVYALTP